MTAAGLRRLAVIGAALLAIWAPPPPAAAASGGLVPDGFPVPALAPSEPLPATAEEVARLLRLFEDGVLRREGGPRMPVLRWEAGVTVSLRGGRARRHAAFVARLLREVEELTGLDLQLVVAAPTSLRIDILLLDGPDHLPPQLASPVPAPLACMALPLAMRGHLRRSQIFINADTLPPETVEACLLEEIVQSLGLVGEVEGDDSTLLSDAVGFRRLTSTDRVLLRALYDRRLWAGMPRQEALRRLPAVIAEKLATQGCAPEAPERCLARAAVGPSGQP